MFIVGRRQNVFLTYTDHKQIQELSCSHFQKIPMTTAKLFMESPGVTPIIIEVINFVEIFSQI